MNQEIPDGWNKVKFKELAKQKSVRIDNPGESGFEKYVGLEHLDSGELVVKRYGSTSDVTSTMKLFNKGNILFARRNTYLKRVSVAPFDSVCSGDIIVLEPILDHIVEGFLPIFMQFEPFENRIIALSAGAFSKRIKWKQLAEEEIVIPSIEEQKKIVEIIWSVQENAEKNESFINTTETLKKGLLNELLTKGIGHNRFKDSILGNIPEEWAIVKLSDIIEKFQYGLSVKPDDSGEYPILKMDNLIDGSVDANLVKYVNIDNAIFEKFKLEKGDILFNRTNSYEHVGRTSIFNIDGDYVFASYLIRLKVNIDLADPHFLTKYLINCNDHLKQIATRSIQQANINAKNLGSLVS